jgi:hypothetical protein
MRRRRLVQVCFAVGVLAVAWLGLSRVLLAQLGPGTFYLAVAPPAAEQGTIRVRTEVSPNRTQIGCESFRYVTTIVNCIEITGAATTGAPTIAAISGPAGDANIDLRLQSRGTGAVVLAGRAQLGITGSALTNLTYGTCSVSAPSALTPFASAIAQTPCLVANSITGNSNVHVQTQDAAPGFGTTGLERGLLLKAATPAVAGGQIRLSFACASSTACPATIAQTYMWWAILP